MNKLLDSKDNVALRRWESETWKIGFIKRVDKGLITPWKIRKASAIRCDVGLILETSASQIFHSCNSIFIVSFKQNFLLQDCVSLLFSQYRPRDIPKGIFGFALIIFGTYARVNRDI